MALIPTQWTLGKIKPSVGIEPEKTQLLSNDVSLLNISGEGTINSKCLCLLIDLLKHFHYDQATKFLIDEKDLIVYVFTIYLFIST